MNLRSFGHVNLVLPTGKAEALLYVTTSNATGATVPRMSSPMPNREITRTRACR
jgi:hypothetical protein